MDELLAAILGAIFECIAEFLLELLLGLIAGLISRLLRRLFVGTRRIGPAWSTIFFALAGFGAGFLSVWLFPHPLVHPMRFHGASLVIAPLLVGIFMAFLGRRIRRQGRHSVAIESFRYGFTFALAMSLMRFVLVSRSRAF